MFANISIFLRDLWALVGPYWRSEERWRSGALLVAVIAMSLGTVGISVLLNAWTNLFYQTFQDKNLEECEHQLIRFCFISSAYIFVSVYQFYLQEALEIRWRRWLTQYYVTRWVNHRAYYRLQLDGSAIDNPDQRIEEDIRDFIFNILSFGLGLLHAVVTLVSFSVILWGLSGIITLAGVRIPGYLLWIALLYATVGTWLIDRVGRPLIRLRFRQQQVNANFRYSLVRLRENAEGVALYGGEAEEARSLARRFEDIVANWWDLIRRDRRLLYYTNGYAQIGTVIPLVAAAPRYFSGDIAFGALIQTAGAFGQVNSSLSWFIQIYGRFATWKSTIDRLIEFDQALTRVAVAGQGEISRRPVAGGDIEIDNLSLWRPDGHPLLLDVSLTLSAGSHTLVSGASGSGKTTLFRALAGLWPYAKGVLCLPENGRFLFLPQRPYLPIATLHSALTFPDPPERHETDRVIEIMVACGLASFAESLGIECNWSQRLSPGEQQRVAIARALLIGPDWLFMDEATASLDLESESRLYRLLRDRLPRTTLISIGHRPSLAAFHDRRLVFQADEQTSAPWLLAASATAS